MSWSSSRRLCTSACNHKIVAWIINYWFCFLRKSRIDVVGHSKIGTSFSAFRSVGISWLPSQVITYRAIMRTVQQKWKSFGVIGYVFVWWKFSIHEIPSRIHFGKFSETQSDSAHSSFRHLKFLNLNNTLLSTWDDIDSLARFPALQCLRVLGCPLFEVSSW